MIELLGYNFEAFNRDAKIAEELMILRNKKELKKGVLEENDRKLLAKLMVSAAYRRDSARINKYLDFIYERLFGKKWHEQQVWMDQPINWLDLELVAGVYGEHGGHWEYETPWSYSKLYGHALKLIEMLWKDRHDI